MCLEIVSNKTGKELVTEVLRVSENGKSIQVRCHIVLIRGVYFYKSCAVVHSHQRDVCSQTTWHVCVLRKVQLELNSPKIVTQQLDFLFG